MWFVQVWYVYVCAVYIYIFFYIYIYIHRIWSVTSWQQENRHHPQNGFTSNQVFLFSFGIFQCVRNSSLNPRFGGLGFKSTGHWILQCLQFWNSLFDGRSAHRATPGARCSFYQAPGVGQTCSFLARCIQGLGWPKQHRMRRFLAVFVLELKFCCQIPLGNKKQCLSERYLGSMESKNKSNIHNQQVSEAWIL